MRESLAVWLVAPFIFLTITACEKVAEAVPIAEANADPGTTYVSQFSAMHSAIPVGLRSDIEEYQ